jgi:hypothetical protein
MVDDEAEEADDGTGAGWKETHHGQLHHETHHHGQLHEDEDGGDHGGNRQYHVLLHKVHTGRNYGNLSVEAAKELHKICCGIGWSVRWSIAHTQIPGTLSYVILNTHVRNGGLVGSVVGSG